MNQRRESTVAVLMFGGAPMFETSVPISVFGVDRTSTGAPSFELLAVAGEEGPLATTGGVQLQAAYGLDAIDRAGIVIAPSWRDPHELPPRPALDALRRAHQEGALIVGLCMGSFVLAAAGLLDGRRAVTHWLHAPTLAAQYPLVEVDPSVLFVDDGEVITSAGTAAGLDVCLHVVRRRWGDHAAAAIARRMVIPPLRSGGQAQYIERPVPAGAEDDGLAEVMTYALTHLSDELDVPALARRALVSRRTFDRRFREVTGTSPLRWLLHQRVMYAQRLLEDTDLPIDYVARQVGLGTGTTLRPHFRRLVGVPPMAYRANFRTPGGTQVRESPTLVAAGSSRTERPASPG